jgi:hypothetical protein
MARGEASVPQIVDYLDTATGGKQSEVEQVDEHEQLPCCPHLVLVVPEVERLVQCSLPARREAIDSIYRSSIGSIDASGKKRTAVALARGKVEDASVRAEVEALCSSCSRRFPSRRSSSAPPPP